MYVITLCTSSGMTVSVILLPAMGATTLHCMLYLAPSSAKVWDKPISPLFAAE